MKYDIQFTNQFKKDLKLAKKQNKDLDKLFEVIDILANGGTLDAKYRDHDLTGNYKGTRECHIEPDWLLIGTMRNNGEFLSGFLRTDKILPVITLTLYFGTEPWDGPLSLREMYDINDSKLLDFVPDYRVQLIQPMTLSEDDFEKFHTSLREVLQTIKYSVDAQKLTEYITQNERMHRLDLSAANVINTVAGIGLEIKQDRGKVDMCKAIEDLKAESRAEGREEGRVEGREEGREEGHTKGRAETIEQTVAMLRNMKIPKETILSELQRTFSLSEEEANRIYNTK